MVAHRSPAEVADGVFFTRPPALPRGRHDLPPHRVVAAQRERMMIAATELMAGGGYRGVGVREVCARASVSRAAFYECFGDKDACVHAAYDRFIAVLVRALGANAPEGKGWDEYVVGFAQVYLGLVRRDPVTARAFLVEMDALGRGARDRRREAVRRLALLLRDKHGQWAAGSGAPLPLSAYAGVVYAMRQLVADALDEGGRDLPDLLPELVGWLPRLVGGAPRETPGRSLDGEGEAPHHRRNDRYVDTGVGDGD